MGKFVSNTHFLKRAIISVTNDLATDRRVEKTAGLLREMGFNVMQIGRLHDNSLPMPEGSVRTKRWKLIWNRGPLFYAEYNIRLFFKLLFSRASLLVANDLDTLLPNYLVSALRKIPLVYDSHEYFTAVPELMDRHAKRRIWERIEEFVLPKLRGMITVSEPIAEIYREKYGIPVEVVRNLPKAIGEPDGYDKSLLGIKPNETLVILQGNGINMGRGAEEAIAAMKYLPKTRLLIIGDGDVMARLPQLVEENQVVDRVIIHPKVAYDELMKYTCMADIGLSIDKDTNLNYRYSLPNKLFDYIQANVPVLVSDLPEVSLIVKEYNIGYVLPDHDPETLAESIRYMTADKVRYSAWKRNTEWAAAELTWENEKQILTRIFAPYA